MVKSDGLALSQVYILSIRSIFSNLGTYSLIELLLNTHQLRWAISLFLLPLFCSHCFWWCWTRLELQSAAAETTADQHRRSITINGNKLCQRLLFNYTLSRYTFERDSSTIFFICVLSTWIMPCELLFIIACSSPYLGPFFSAIRNRCGFNYYGEPIFAWAVIN